MKAIMITSGVKQELNHKYIGGLRKNLLEHERQLAQTFLRAIGREVVDDIVWRIHNQSTPDGLRQRPNSPNTFRDKQARGVRPNIPLVDSGTLIRANNYRINLSHQGRAVQISLPSSRVAIATKLARQGYYFFGLPHPVMVERIITKAHDSMPAQEWFDLLYLFNVRGN